MTQPPIRGRVVTASGDQLVIRDHRGALHVLQPEAARVGDWVEVDGDSCRVVSRPRGFGAGTGRVFERRDHLGALRVRSEVLRVVREFFHERELIEIEPSLLVEHPALEVHIDAVEAGERYLISSPEYQLKRLLAEGVGGVFSLCRCFRAGERGHQHAVEFTMLEWYRSFAELGAILRDTEELIARVLMQVAGQAVITAGGRQIPVAPPFDVVTVGDLFSELVGIELRGDEDAGELGSKLQIGGVDTGTAEHWDDLFYTAFVDRIEPALSAWPRPVFVVDWPIRLGALARQRPGNPAVVERFELYIGGVELANAFGELTDPVEQRRRFELDRHDRQVRGKPTYSLDERFLSALEHGMPPAAGIALGIDRLVMLALGAEHIAEVQAFADGEV